MDESNIRVLHEGVHNHEEDDGVIGHDKILNSMKEVIRQDPSVPLKLIYPNYCLVAEETYHLTKTFSMVRV
jgi:hypothetical protein